MKTDFTDRTILVGGKPPLRRRPDFWAKFLSEFMDLLAYASIFISGEVHAWPMLVALGLGAIRLLSRFRFRTLWMLSGFLLLIFVGLQLSLRLQLHPLVSAAHIAPLALGWIGLTRGSEDLWGWRMGLGFICLILASVLSPDFSVTLFILLYIVAGSIALSCRFLDSEFTRRGVIGSLPKGFVRSSLKQTGILFLAALIIFPLVPRVQGRGTMNFGGRSLKSGYNEEIGLSEWSRVSANGSSAPALRIYGPDGSDPTDYIPGGLLRSRVLSVLGKNRWDPLPVRLNPISETEHSGIQGRLRIVREMIGTPNLPVPYGTSSASVELYGYEWRAEKTMASEWREARARNRRFTYSVAVGSEDKIRPQDSPSGVDLRVPENFLTPRMKGLAAKLFKGLKDPKAKIYAVQTYFRKEGFEAKYLEDEPLPKTEAGVENLQPIERFLFVEKNGHCVYFASSMAILLRLGGIPARLIAGFRVSRNAFGDVLTIRQADAHAWVEAYVPGLGWQPFDPTPKVLHTLAITDWLRDSYDFASAKWTQYILNYGEGQNSLIAQFMALKKLSTSIASGKNPFEAGDTEVNTYLFLVIFIVGAALLSFSAVALFRTLRRRHTGRRESRWVRTLRKERDAFEAAIDSGIDHRLVEEWFTIYERARFGAVEPADHTATLHDLRERRNEIRRSRKIA